MSQGLFGLLGPAAGHPPAELGGPHTARDGTRLAAVDGAIRWTDESLRRMAEERGEAAALLAAHRSLGRGLLERARGHFAFAIFDEATAEAMLAVDRMGTRPLAYALAADGTLIVAGNAERIVRCGRHGAEVDPQALFDYAFFHMVPSPGTIWRGVSKLEPATVVQVARGAAEASRYWQPRYDFRASERELAARLMDALHASVRRCRPDAATGAFLSGGLDSSTVSGVLSRVHPPPTRTFSIGFAEAGYDEMHYARVTSRHFGTEAHEYYVQHEDIAEAIPRIAAAYDEPFGNSSAVPTMFCARLARGSGVTRMLAGDGGDELFGGNERYAKQKVFERYFAVPAAIRSLLIEPLARGPVGALPGPFSKARSYVLQANVHLPLRLHTYNFVQRHGAAEIFAPDFLASIDPTRPAHLLESTWAAAPTDDPVDRMLYLDWKFTLADNDLRKVSRMCELEGIQVAYPMLDDELIDLSLEVPPQWKVKGTELRWFYKRAMEGFLPREVIEKTKHGFGLPFGEWLKKSRALQTLVYDSLASIGRRGFLRPQFTAELIAAHRDGHAAYYGTFVWVLVMLEQWLEAHAPRT